jgi:hypothetical protein
LLFLAHAGGIEGLLQFLETELNGLGFDRMERAGIDVPVR